MFISNINTLPRIFVIGAPASGKTTSRTFVANYFVSRGYNLEVLGIEEAQRELFTPDKEDETYFYDTRGALILNQRDEQIPKALSLLIHKSRIAMISTGFVLELAHRNTSKAILSFDEGILQGALIIHLYTPLSTRLFRNLDRGPMTIPEIAVTSIPDTLTDDDLEVIRGTGAKLTTIDSSKSINLLLSELTLILDSYYSHISRS